MKNLEQLIFNTILQLRLNAVLKAALVGLGAAFIGLGFGLATIWVLIFVLVSFTFILAGLGVFTNQRVRAKKILHRRLRVLEYSLELLDKRERNIAEVLQLQRIEQQIRNVQPPRIFLQSLLPFVVFLLISGGIFGMSLLSKNDAGKPVTAVDSKIDITYENHERIPVSLEESKVTIIPPAYTGEKRVEQSQLNIKALEGSTVRWSLNFSRQDSLKVVLASGAGNEILFEKDGDGYVLSDRLAGSGIYAIKAYEKDSIIFESEYHTLEAILDKSPVIVPEEKDLYKYHFVKDPLNHTLEAKVSDDYLVRQTFLVATLARGSGENVKFRENRIALSPTDYKNANIKHQLDLAAMDFRPGDELYYYWLAIDNKIPEANISQSDTYFIQYVDTTGLNESQLEGMAIHVLPDYFRSQRQIIIDTEKLISEKKKLAENTYNENSNELGHEQKLLRMRYGQYLGEEYENNAPGGSFNTEEGQDLLEGFRHDHDHEGEQEHHENEETSLQVPEEHQHDHDHGGESGGDNELASLLESYLHNHDSEDANTFYEQSTRSMLKMALEQMWQSELHLRLFEPEKALPYQKQALEYLKSVQQKSRVYVKRTGFDSPPIKEAEKRLTGELDDIDQLRQREIAASENQLALLASKLLGFLNIAELDESEKETIQAFGSLWVERMESSGMQDWRTLLWIQKLGSGELDQKESRQLYQKLVQITQGERQYNLTKTNNKDLAKAFWKNLK